MKLPLKVFNLFLVSESRHGAGILYQSHRDGLFRQFFEEQESLFTSEVVERNGIDIVAPRRQENHQAFCRQALNRWLSSDRILIQAIRILACSLSRKRVCMDNLQNN